MIVGSMALRIGWRLNCYLNYTVTLSTLLKIWTGKTYCIV